MTFEELVIGDSFYYLDGRETVQSPDIHVKVSETEHGIRRQDGTLETHGTARNYPVAKIEG